METIIRAIVIIFTIYVGVHAFREMRSGVLRIQDEDEPAIFIRRHERPIAFWSCLAAFYTILAAIIAAIAFVPFKT